MRVLVRHFGGKTEAERPEVGNRATVFTDADDQGVQWISVTNELVDIVLTDGYRVFPPDSKTDDIHIEKANDCPTCGQRRP